jgi:hypothetical protein
MISARARPRGLRDITIRRVNANLIWLKSRPSRGSVKGARLARPHVMPAASLRHHVERIPGDVNPLAGAAADVRDLTIRAPGLSTAERSVGHRHMPG